MKKDDVKIYTNLVKDLSDIMNESKLTRLKFKHKNAKDKDGIFKITIELENQPHGITNITSTPQMMSYTNPTPVTTPSSITTETNSNDVDYTNHEGSILSPMVGIVYTSANPESAPFVEVGSTVNEGDTLLLIEAMKVFNPIKAPKSGKVTKIFVKNNSPVEFNELLLIIE
ncbi:Biotin carboxyl carrier protein of acetyl-CoA carboxylase [Candidatus Hepatincola sp. Pdp]